MDPQTIEFYQKNAQDIGARYAAAENPVSDYISLYLPSNRSTGVLDAGCGSGVIAQELFNRGFLVSACDPVPEMYKNAASTQPGITFFKSTLEELVNRKEKYQAVSCQAVLQHIPDGDLVSSLTGLVEVCTSGGYLFVSVPVQYPVESNNRDEKGRLFLLRDKNLYIHLLRRLGCRLVHYVLNDDSLGRSDVQWVLLIFQKESLQGTSPIRMIDSIIREDKKITTYKFALLRSIVDLALQRPNLARYETGDRVSIPKDELVDRWIEYYWPLVQYTGDSDKSILYQGQKIAGKQDISFRSSLGSIIKEYESHGGVAGFFADVRSPNRLSPEMEKNYKNATKEILKAISQPIRYSGNKSIGGDIFTEERTGSGCYESQNQSKNQSKNEIRVCMPAGMWYEFSHFGTWIIDSLILRWAEKTATIQQKNSSPAPVKKEHILGLLLNDSLPDRYTAYMRNLYNPLIETHQLTCVWSNTQITRHDQYQVDHVLPYSLWYNNDMWNLLPTINTINNEKRDKLPSLKLMNDVKPRILELWDFHYEKNPGLFLHQAAMFIGTKDAEYSQEMRQELFIALRDTMELGARQRNIPRWK